MVAFLLHGHLCDLTLPSRGEECSPPAHLSIQALGLKPREEQMPPRMIGDNCVCSNSSLNEGSPSSEKSENAKEPGSSQEESGAQVHLQLCVCQSFIWDEEELHDKS